MPDFLDTKHREIDDRLRQLKPLVDEYTRLQTAAKALGGLGGRGSAPTKGNGRRKRGRPRASGSSATNVVTKSRSAATRRAARRKGTGPRAVQALALVQAQPGIAIPQLASKMGISQNYLYRVMPGLEKEKKVRKKDRGWHPTG